MACSRREVSLLREGEKKLKGGEGKGCEVAFRGGGGEVGWCVRGMGWVVQWMAKKA